MTKKELKSEIERLETQIKDIHYAQERRARAVDAQKVGMERERMLTNTIIDLLCGKLPADKMHHAPTDTVSDSSHPLFMDF